MISELKSKTTDNMLLSNDYARPKPDETQA